MQDEKRYAWLATLVQLWQRDQRDDSDGKPGVADVLGVAGRIEGVPSNAANDIAAQLLAARLLILWLFLAWLSAKYRAILLTRRAVSRKLTGREFLEAAPADAAWLSLVVTIGDLIGQCQIDHLPTAR